MGGSGKYEGRPHEGFYTQEQVKRIVRYAADRNITIVPEIDIPGHSAAAIVSYPELKLSARPRAEVPVSFNDGAAFDPTSERAYQFLGDIMTELASLFPEVSFTSAVTRCGTKSTGKACPTLKRS